MNSRSLKCFDFDEFLVVKIEYGGRRETHS